MTAMWRGWGQAIAIVDIVNGSNKAVSMVTVQFDTCALRATLQSSTPSTSSTSDDEATRRI
jgi:hypothetical protein